MYKANAGAFMEIPWKLDLKILLAYENKRYDNIDSMFGFTRKDTKYKVDVSVSRPIIDDWLVISLDLGYTKNDSNVLKSETDYPDIKEFEYHKKTAAISISATY